MQNESMGGRTLLIFSVIFLLAGLAWLLFRPTAGPEMGEAASRQPPPAAVSIPSHPGSEPGTLAVPPTREIPVPEKMSAKSPPLPVDLSAADRDLDLFGTVVNESGEPIAGCELETFTVLPWQGRPADFEENPEPEPGPSTRSASDGTFSLRLERAQVVDLHATADGHARTIVPQCNAGEKVRVVLSEPASLLITVTDSDEEPIERAKIDLWLSYQQGSAWTNSGNEKGLTNSEGKHLFRNIHWGFGWIWVAHERHGQASQQVRIKKKESAEIRVILRGSRGLRGRVTDADTGKPITGASIESWGGSAGGTETDAEGKYEVRAGVSNFMWQLTARAEGYTSGSKAIPPRGDLDFALQRGDIVIGAVRDSSGNPLGDVRVWASGSGFEDHNQVTDSVSTLTGTDGGFSLEGLRSSIAHSVSISRTGFGKLGLRLDHSRAVDGVIDLGTIVLPAPRSIEGQAVSDGGAPLPRANVTISPVGQHDVEATSLLGIIGGSDFRMTDDLGRFRFPGLAPGGYILTLSVAGSPEVRMSVTLPADADLLDVELRALAGETLRVRVQDSSGAPVQGVWVSSFNIPGATHVSATTGADGTALLRGLPEREISVSISSQLEGLLQTPPQSVIPAGQEVLFVLEAAALIRGTVKGPDGAPVPGITLTASFQRKGLQPAYGFSGADGSFTISCPVGTIADISVSGSPMSMPGGRDSQEQAAWFQGGIRGIAAPAEGVEISLERLPLDRSVVVLVLDPDGNSVTGATVFATSASILQSNNPWVTGTDGRVRLENLAPTEVTISVSLVTSADAHRDTLPQASIKVIPEGQEVTVRFSRGVSMSGIVLDADGNPAGWCRIMAESRVGPVAFAGADEAGRFRIVVPERGAYRLQAQTFWENGSVKGTGAVSVTAPAEGVKIVIEAG
ncbi:MAG: carboxypeptidase regulatory-like domain-containing protein [Planctomycetota bacterium]|nr:carboxypeptidase regulatory-like domain-containing protein [Planctomycetota bacterium]